MMKPGKISPLAFSRMKQRGISIDALNHLLAHGQVEKQFDGARVPALARADVGVSNCEALFRAGNGLW